MPRHRLSRNLFYERAARVRIIPGHAAFSPHRVTASACPVAGDGSSGIPDAVNYLLVRFSPVRLGLLVIKAATRIVHAELSRFV